MKKLLRYIEVLRNLLRPDKKTYDLSRYLRVDNQVKDIDFQRPLILVQCIEDNLYYGLFGQVISKIKNLAPAHVELFVLNSLRLGESGSLIGFFRATLIHRLLCFKWINLYKQFANGIGYHSTSFNPLCDLLDLYKCFLIKKRLKTKDDLVSLVIDGVLVGDLVNDSYLRFKPAPTVNLSDLYLFYIIWQAHRDVRRSTRYFRKTHPDLYLTSYSTYIQHGIAVRVALKFGVKVHALYSNYQQLFKILSIEDCSHTKKTQSYAENFLNLANQEEKLKEAKNALSSRLSGAIDSATLYMKKSVYRETTDSVPYVRGSLVVFLHDFFDSPHVYRSMVFTDFWEWICFTIEHLQAQGIRFFLKPHPNQVSASNEVITALKNRYDGLLWIPVEITNKQLVDGGMACAVTVYGTVAHEMAYLGVPTIACGDHPHIAFDFCRTAVTKNDYAKLLDNYSTIHFDKDVMQEQSLIFYYMHNLDIDPEEKKLLTLINKYAKSCEDPSVNSEKLVHELSLISNNAAFNGYISRIITSIQ